MADKISNHQVFVTLYGEVGVQCKCGTKWLWQENNSNMICDCGCSLPKYEIVEEVLEEGLALLKTNHKYDLNKYKE